MSTFSLKRVNRFGNRGRSLLFIIMDGVGQAAPGPANAVTSAYTPLLDELFSSCPMRFIKAHGIAVGLPSDADMGNSEVGHNAFGAGRVFAQGAKLVNQAIESKALFKGEAWTLLVDRVKKGNSTLHFMGLLSDGNVHSHIDQLIAMIREAHSQGVSKIRIHALLDGRDVPETSSPEYIKKLEQAMDELPGNPDYRIASGGGRMITTMDRYEADWSIVERGWETHVAGKGKTFKSALEAIETLRAETGANDQFLPPFVIVDDRGTPVGPIRDGDSVILFNFRGDRAIEISRAFDEPNFDCFKREPYPDVAFAGMMQYDGDTKTPKRFLVSPPEINDTLGEYMAETGITQLALAETQKYGHVTYFWNGNRSGYFSKDLEEYIEVTSDLVPFEQRPWMKSAEVVDAFFKAVESQKYDFLRINFANGDMVGHTGHFQAACIAVETVDLALQRLKKWVDKEKAIMVISADHGNADQMFQIDSKTGAVKLDKESGLPVPLTSHTLNPVPFLIYDPLEDKESGGSKYLFREDQPSAGLANVAATLLDIMGFEAPEEFEKSLLS